MSPPLRTREEEEEDKEEVSLFDNLQEKVFFGNFRSRKKMFLLWELGRRNNTNNNNNE